MQKTRKGESVVSMRTGELILPRGGHWDEKNKVIKQAIGITMDDLMSETISQIERRGKDRKRYHKLEFKLIMREVKQ